MNRLTFVKKRHIELGCFLFVFFVGILVFPSGVYAADEVYSTPWDGTVTAVTPNGNTYTVNTAEELAWIAQQNASLNGFRGKTVKLAANIDLNGADRKRVWTPIGSKDHPFEGTFDGARHLIRGLTTIDTDEGVGLFGYVGSRGKVNDVGISGGCIIAYRQNRVGALIGVCEGSVSCCWSMAEIAMSGNVTGGLIGEMLRGSKLTDAYCCGLIRNAGDTIGVLVGKNAGTITNAYTTGYAKNGCSFVGLSESRAKYENCYYDRKLYYQEPGAVAKGLTAVDTTYRMFDCMKGKSNWTTTSHTSTEQGLYPQLTKFKHTDASRLSVAPVIVDTESQNPINHANDLTEDFRVDKRANITWQTQEIVGSTWIQFSDESDKVTVIRPCAETDVLTTATLTNANNIEQRTVYFRPRRVDDLKPGTFDGINFKDTICWKEEVAVSELVKSEDVLLRQKKSFYAQDGFGTHHYMVVRFGYDQDKQLYAIDTLERDLKQDTIQYFYYTAWYETAMIKSDTAGDFMLRVFVHDDRCAPDWMPCVGQLRYTVLPELLPGVIIAPEDRPRHDTIYLDDKDSTTLKLTAYQPASGGSGHIGYAWRNEPDGSNITPFSSDGNLNLKVGNPKIGQPYYYYRYVIDSTHCEGKLSDGVYIVTYFKQFKPGAVTERNTPGMDRLVFCTVEDAYKHTVKASRVTGGTGTYYYQWFIQQGSSVTKIDPATGCDLELSDLKTAGITLEEGKEYVFLRKAKDDTRFTEWTQSVGKQTIYIAIDLNPGVIPTKWDTLYLDGNSSVDIHVKALQPASEGSGTYSYAWRNSEQGANITPLSEKGDLSYTLTAATAKLTFYRYVDDGTECGKKISEGVYTVTVFDSLRTGSINTHTSPESDKLVFCTVDDAKAYTITATRPTGGSGTYLYQWYTQSGTKLNAISGATSAELDLSIVTLQAGRDYTFVRQVTDNTSHTTWTLSDSSQTIHIMQAIDAGAIESGERAQCFEPDEYVRTISVLETKAASGEGVLQYRWLRINGSKQEVIAYGTTSDYKDLYYGVFAYETSGNTYTYVREVRQDDCEWVRSDGEIKESYGIKQTGELTRTICVTQLPDTIYWQDSKGKVFSHIIAKGKTTDVWNVRDEYNHGKSCPADTIITTYIQDKPLISSESSATFCQNESNITISYEQKSGEVDVFYIEYSSQLAKYMGKSDTVGVIHQPGTIVIKNVPPLPDVSGLYIDLQVGSSAGTYNVREIGCYSDVQRVQLESRLGGYVHAKFNRVLYVDNNPDNGEVPAPKLHFKAYQWYKNGTLMDGQTGQYYQENGKDLQGVYYVLLTDDKGNSYRSCEIIMPNEEYRSSAHMPALYPVPVDAGAPLTVTCYGGTIEICSGTGERVLTAGTDKESMVIDAPRVTGIYHVRITRADGTTQTEKLIVK